MKNAVFFLFQQLQSLNKDLKIVAEIIQHYFNSFTDKSLMILMFNDDVSKQKWYENLITLPGIFLPIKMSMEHSKECIILQNIKDFCCAIEYKNISLDNSIIINIDGIDINERLEKQLNNSLSIVEFVENNDESKKKSRILWGKYKSNKWKLSTVKI